MVDKQLTQLWVWHHPKQRLKEDSFIVQHQPKKEFEEDAIHHDMAINAADKKYLINAANKENLMNAEMVS